MFLTEEEMTTHIYEEVGEAISQGDETLLESAIESAVSEAKGYCSRFNIPQVFDNADADPDYVKDAVLLMHVKSMAKWHFIGLSNPSIDYDDAQTRYEQAISWLLKIQNGKVVPYGWPPAVEPEGAHTFFHFKSNPKRRNHY